MTAALLSGYGGGNSTSTTTAGGCGRRGAGLARATAGGTEAAAAGEKVESLTGIRTRIRRDGDFQQADRRCRRRIRTSFDKTVVPVPADRAKSSSDVAIRSHRPDCGIVGQYCWMSDFPDSGDALWFRWMTILRDKSQKDKTLSGS